MIEKIYTVISEQGFRKLFLRILSRIFRQSRNILDFIVDSIRCTYKAMQESEAVILNQVINKEIVKTISRSVPKEVEDLYISHYFDILGSGFHRVYYGMKARVIEGKIYQIEPSRKINRSNKKEAERISGFIDDDYKSIDWHIDFKSGFRWNEKTWSKFIQHGRLKGSDIKVPWELSRMQHLPQMAIQFLSDKTDQERKELLQREFQNQAIDFIANNPPNFGVNWSCPMDVSIRCSNLLLASDLFNNHGFKFKEEFKKIFTESVYAHGNFIIDNLEWNHGYRGNHYLSNIAGIAFISSYLPSSKETDAWLAFSIQELISEVNYQFYSDGTNFEGSTAYHRLASEMVLYATAIILGLPNKRLKSLLSADSRYLKTKLNKPKLDMESLKLFEFTNCLTNKEQKTFFPPWYFERLERMIEFVIDITKPNGLIPQLGDNDSGRFFKLKPEYQEMKVGDAKSKYANLDSYEAFGNQANYYMEEHLDCAHLIYAASAIFKREDFNAIHSTRTNFIKHPDFRIMKSILNNVQVKSIRYKNRLTEKNKHFSNGEEEYFSNKFFEVFKKDSEKSIKYKYESNADISKEIILKSYRDFGLFLFTSPNLFLSIRCWTGKEPYSTSHMHLDQFMIELVIDGKELVTDPGTYLYEPFPEIRETYRSNKAHFSPLRVGTKNNRYLKEVFGPIEIEPAVPVHFSEKGFLCKSSLEGEKRYFGIEIEKNSINVYFYGEIEEPDRQNNKLRFSPGYGIVMNMDDEIIGRG